MSAARRTVFRRSPVGWAGTGTVRVYGARGAACAAVPPRSSDDSREDSRDVRRPDWAPPSAPRSLALAAMLPRLTSGDEIVLTAPRDGQHALLLEGADDADDLGLRLLDRPRADRAQQLDLLGEVLGRALG